MITRDTKMLMILCLVLSFTLSFGVAGPEENMRSKALRELIPEMPEWALSEDLAEYNPETLFEYIDGAAEIYLAYDFQTLLVAQFKKQDSEASLSIEVYDMGKDKNSFGIYSAERFPGNHFIPLGVQGYEEDGALNFFVGRYYVKLLCFDCESEPNMLLKNTAEKILKAAGDKGQFPRLLRAFPKEGLVSNSEKFILRNFLGYNFLHDGYTAEYTLDGMEFVCFVIEEKTRSEAQNTLKRYVEEKRSQAVQEIPAGFRIEDPFNHTIFLTEVDRWICGVMRLEKTEETIGDKYLRELVKNVKMIQTGI